VSALRAWRPLGAERPHKISHRQIAAVGGGGKWGYVEPKFQAVYTFSGKAAVVKP